MRNHRYVLAATAGLIVIGCGAEWSASETSGTTTAADTAGGGVELIAIGSIQGTDLADETAAPLENGVAGNLLGGFGSGIAWAGGDTFVAVPDRGPNAVAYDAAIDDTASYVSRLQTFELALVPARADAPLPFALAPQLVDTTLLWSHAPLAYGSGEGLGVPSGAPLLGTKQVHYFTGRSDGFDAAESSGDPRDARLDPESVRVTRDGRHVFVSDEYGPYVYEFDRDSGRRVLSIALPPELFVTTLSPQGDVEIARNAAGRVANKGMEGLAITPNGTTLVGAMQSPLLQDGGTSGRFTRIVTIDVECGTTKQYAYELTNIGSASKPKYPTVSDILAVNDHVFLVDERDGKGRGDGSNAAFKKIHRVDLAGATDVTGVFGEEALAGKQLAKSVFVDLVAALGAHGVAPSEVPAKIEGLAFGHDIVIGTVKKHTLFVTNDDDFLDTITDDLHPSGEANPNQFFVFAIDPAALPDFVPQRLRDGD